MTQARRHGASRIRPGRLTTGALAIAALIVALALVSSDRTLGPVRVGFCTFALRDGNFRCFFPSSGTFHWIHAAYSDLPLTSVFSLPRYVARCTYSEESPASSAQNPTPAVMRAWFDLLIVPLWIPAALFGLFGAASYRRQYVRRSAQACLTCGYDLTGNASGACPECGTRVERQDYQIHAGRLGPSSR